MSIDKQPVSAVEWVHREEIEPNDYNPNRQQKTEHNLLKLSILKDGWTQPIVVFDDKSGGKPVIVDGEHRWRTSADDLVYSLTDGYVPIVRILKSREERILATVRHNRARGDHLVDSMAGLVTELLEGGMSTSSLCEFLGMEDEEVKRLAEKAGQPEVVARVHSEFGKSWVPK